jgi:hypothetical protein
MPFRDESGGCPNSWPGGVRHTSDVSLSCGFGTERWKACHDTGALVEGAARGSVPSGLNSQGIEYRRVAGRRTGS